jgi:hypothetical protein
MSSRASRLRELTGVYGLPLGEAAEAVGISVGKAHGLLMALQPETDQEIADVVFAAYGSYLQTVPLKSFEIDRAVMAELRLREIRAASQGDRRGAMRLGSWRTVRSVMAKLRRMLRAAQEGK